MRVVLIFCIDERRWNIRTKERNVGIIVRMIPHPVNIELGLAILRSIHCGYIQFNFDIAFTPARFNLINVFVFVHQSAVIGAKYHACPGAAGCFIQLNGILHFKNRQIMGIEHQIIIAPANPGGTIPGCQIRIRIHQTGFEP